MALPPVALSYKGISTHHEAVRDEHRLTDTGSMHVNGAEHVEA